MNPAQSSVIPTQYAIHAWFAGGHGLYCVRAFSEDEARGMATEAIREQFHVPEDETVHAQIVR